MALFSTLTADRRIIIFVLLFYAGLPCGDPFIRVGGFFIGKHKRKNSLRASNQPETIAKPEKIAFYAYAAAFAPKMPLCVIFGDPFNLQALLASLDKYAIKAL